VVCRAANEEICKPNKSPKANFYTTKTMRAPRKRSCSKSKQLLLQEDSRRVISRVVIVWEEGRGGLLLLLERVEA